MMKQLIYNNQNDKDSTLDALHGEHAGKDDLELKQKLVNDLTISILVPPLNFAMVAPGIYRSGFPNTKNHKFLLSLGLKKIIYTYNGNCLEYHKQFCAENDITLLHYRLEANKEPFQEMNQEAVAKIIVEILDTRNHPILVHCNRGVRRVGCIVGCLRRMQGWVMTAIFEEFQRFSGNRIRIPDQEFIEVFSQSVTLQLRQKPS